MTQSYIKGVENSEKIIKEFDEKFPLRILNADNPQYVLGWNVMRELSKSFLLSALASQKEEIREKIKKLRKIEDDIWDECFNKTLDEVLKILK